MSSQDHRSLGQQLKLYCIDPDVGKGLPLWLPNGTVIRDELERYAQELEFKAGYQRVATPHIARESLYQRSGHLPYYESDMYPIMRVTEDVEKDATVGSAVSKDAYVLKPMNCPHHHRVFAALPRSYRELPLRLSEYGQVYRWEGSGALLGLSRVRGMCMNDGHIYCTADQLGEEFASVFQMYKTAYSTLGITDYRFRLSCRDEQDGREKYVDDDAAWRWSQSLLRDLLDQSNIDYFEQPGHAAFYGPKIDIQVRTALGHEETLSTVQLDFSQPQALGLHYIDTQGNKTTPYCIHRSPLSTHERLIAYLLERYQGAFPTWLAPVQVAVVPVSVDYHQYAKSLYTKLRERFVRVELNEQSETVSYRIRDAVTRKIPNVLIVGKREESQGTVSLRQYGISSQQTMLFTDFQSTLQRSIVERENKLFNG